MSATGHIAERLAFRICAIAVVIALAGCATWKAPTNTSDAPLRARAMTESHRDVQLSAAVLSRDDGIRMFGVDLDAAGVQPVWIEVRNGTTQALWLLRSGTDPDYFSPLEVAWSAHVKFGGDTNARIDEHFDELAFQNPIPPGQTRSGILFTNPQPVTKLLNVDLLGDKTMIPFTLFVPTPDTLDDPYQQHIHDYAPAELTQCEDLASLRKAIEALPCCTTREAGTAGGPVNLVLIGDLTDIAAALARRGYRRMREVDSNIQMFGRAADLVVHKLAQAAANANWIRVWRAPISYRDQIVLVGQAVRPVGGRFARDVRGEKLHADVDEVRNIVIQQLLYSGGLAQIGLVTGVGRVPPDQPRTLANGAHYYTDGLRAVLFFATRPLTFADVKELDWESMPGASVAKENEGAPR